jgi:hypothetical protein
MLDFVEDGDELVSVLGASAQTRLCFLGKPGPEVECYPWVLDERSALSAVLEPSPAPINGGCRMGY